MDNNPLSVLRAQVEAATPFDLKVQDRYTSPGRVWTIEGPEGDEGRQIAEVLSRKTYLPDAHLLATGWNLLRRMVSDEAIEQAARAYEDSLLGPFSAKIAWEKSGPRRVEAMRAALSSLLTGGV